MAPFDEERQRKRERERTWGCVWERKLNKNKREERERGCGNVMCQRELNKKYQKMRR